MARKDYEYRLGIVEKLRAMNYEVYPHKVELAHTVKEIVENQEELMGSKVKTAGRIVGYREHGKLIFCDIFDDGFKVQLMVKKDVLQEDFKFFKNMRESVFKPKTFFPNSPCASDESSRNSRRKKEENACGWRRG